MNRKAKKLLKENNKFEMNLSKESNDVLTDIVAYLRGSKLSEYNQELVRQDINHMFYEGERRKQNVQDIIGRDYKAFSDDIIKEFPEKTLREKIAEYFSVACYAFIISTILSFIVDFIVSILAYGEISFTVQLRAGRILSFALVIILSVLIVKFICKTSFNDKKYSKIKSFLILWVIFSAVIGALVFIQYYLNYVVLEVNFLVIIITDLILFGLVKIMENR